MDNISDPNQEIKVQRTIAFSAAEIYSAFADPMRLAKWWGPNDFTNTFEKFEFKVGGEWKFTMHGPDGSKYPNESTFKLLEPGKKIVIRHLSQPHFVLTVSLLPNEAGTQVIWSSLFEDPNIVASIRHIAEPGAEQNLDRLSMHLQGKL